ncbi:DNA binding domain, excisionase family [Micrococcus luteus]|nr:DNA binding domain, excisionase family [Micrococcus luteus]RBO89268.1 excisionase family DNA binding protein [Micrococcus sp. KT16]VXB58225.1 DNA binding domain, excisionase family [Micrococcus luteus]
MVLELRGEPDRTGLRFFRLKSHTACMETKPNATRTVLPPADLEEMLDLSRFLGALTQPAALLGPDGQTVPLPLEAFNVLREVVEAMQVGKAITVAPVDQMLTTQEAANFLGISRPTLVKLLEGGELAHELTSGGRHRRVRLQDVVQYQEAKRRDRRAALEDLTGSASEAGLYDEDADRYRQALRQARRDLGRQAR